MLELERWERISEANMVWDPTSEAMTPAQTPSGDKTPSLEQQWNAYLQNPTVRAGLLGFGTSMLQGGWGNFGQQLGGAVANGAEAAGNVALAQQQQENKDAALGMQQQELDQNATLKREDIAARKSIANTMAANRVDVANIRGTGGPSNLQEQRMFLAAKARRAKALSDANFFADEADKMDDVTLDSLAAQQALHDLEQARQNTGGAIAPPPVAQGGQTVQGPGGSAPPQGSPPAANVGAPESPPSDGVYRPNTLADFNKVPKGAKFFNPADQKVYTKQ
jgi:hypothetical protein